VQFFTSGQPAAGKFFRSSGRTKTKKHTLDLLRCPLVVALRATQGLLTEPGRQY
jgi:hypothetical protein